MSKEKEEFIERFENLFKTMQKLVSDEVEKCLKNNPILHEKFVAHKAKTLPIKQECLRAIF